jgi:hypothetical protein
MLVAAGSLFAGCTRNVHGGDPACPLSNTNGTDAVLDCPPSQLAAAISNAFIGNRFRGMKLEPAAQNNYMPSNFPNAGGFILWPLMGPTTNIPLRGGKPITVPYSPVFHITTQEFGNQRSKVKVQTVSSEVTDGKEPGVHGGWANHVRAVKPVKAEEEAVIEHLRENIRAASTKMHSGGNP